MAAGLGGGIIWAWALQAGQDFYTKLLDHQACEVLLDMFNHITSTQIGFQLSYGASDIRLQTELGMECTGFPVLYYTVYQTGIQTFQPEIRANPAKYRMQMFLMPNSVYCWKLIN